MTDIDVSNVNVNTSGEGREALERVLDGMELQPWTRPAIRVYVAALQREVAELRNRNRRLEALANAVERGLNAVERLQEAQASIHERENEMRVALLALAKKETP